MPEPKEERQPYSRQRFEYYKRQLAHYEKYDKLDASIAQWVEEMTDYTTHYHYQHKDEDND